MRLPKIQKTFDGLRAEMDSWNLRRPKNFFESDANFKSSLKFWFSPPDFSKNEALLKTTGKKAGTNLNLWAIETNRDENLPKLRRFDANGNRIEGIDFHPLYHDMGRAIYGSGIMALFKEPGQDLLQLSLFYLFAQNGEAGHCCPLACTAGAIKLISRVGSPELKEKFLPRLLDPNYDTHLHASQFLTEIQGGSDVGATQTIAREDGDRFRLYGEKWFCSVIDAPLWVLTARPEGAPDGTRGLTTFVAPRFLEDGKPNHFEIKRIKYKVGTRSMASAEIDLNGLEAFPVGDAGEGFKYVVDIVLNTSRLYNAFAAAGFMRRATVEGFSFAHSRRAFGQLISTYPLVQRSLARLRAGSALSLALCLKTASLAAKISDGTATKEETSEFRFLVNANKYWSAIRCTQLVREAIEILGGNGTIEEFSVLPRLFRDAIVLESWEGSHNVLCLQILKDMQKYEIHEALFARAFETLKTVKNPDIEKRLKSIQEKGTKLLKLEPRSAQLAIRVWLDQLMPLLEALSLSEEALAEKARAEDTLKDTIVHYAISSLDDRDIEDSVLAKFEKTLAQPLF